MVASSASRASVSARAGAAAMASDFGTNSAGWENSTGSASLGEMITRVPMRTLSNSFSAKPKGIRTQPCEAAYPGNAKKMAALLQAQAANKTDRPILLRVDTKAGHGVGKPVGKI